MSLSYLTLGPQARPLDVRWQAAVDCRCCRDFKFLNPLRC